MFVKFGGNFDVKADGIPAREALQDKSREDRALKALDF